MDVLVIGGTSFIGLYLVCLLTGMGDSVGVFHRGKSRLDLPAEHIFGDWPSTAAPVGSLQPVVLTFIVLAEFYIGWKTVHPTLCHSQRNPHSAPSPRPTHQNRSS
jgi:nucleoside-diphosphate-sugar epimerase